MDKRYFLYITIIIFLYFSCSETKDGNLKEIPVDNRAKCFITFIRLTALDLELNRY